MTETTETPTAHNNADQVLTIGGETITMRAFRYREGLEAAALARPLLAEMRAMMTDAGAEIQPEALDTLLANHLDIWLALVAKACDRFRERSA